MLRVPYQVIDMRIVSSTLFVLTVLTTSDYRAVLIDCTTVLSTPIILTEASYYIDFTGHARGATVLLPAVSQ